MIFSNENYIVLREIFKGQRFPLAFVDLDAFDSNIAYVADKTNGTGKIIRLGSKSIRCEPLMKRILDYGDVYRGFLTYTVEETKFLADKGYDDFIVAYPTVQPSDIELLIRLTREGRSVSVMIDSPQHSQPASK
jgi:D-serine deaminase-like pyridoxal phosphate-dependent protein